jgi:hypothetical protein
VLLPAYIRFTRLTVTFYMDRAEYASISESLADALDFTQTIGLDSGREAQSYERGGGHGVLREVDLYTRSVPWLIGRPFLTN